MEYFMAMFHLSETSPILYIRYFRGLKFNPDVLALMQCLLVSIREALDPGQVHVSAAVAGVGAGSRRFRRRWMVSSTAR